MDVMAVELTPEVVEGLSLMESPPESKFQLPQLCMGDRMVFLKLSTWLDLKFGIDTRVWDKPDDAAARPENARLHVNLAGAVLTLLEALDAKAQRLFEAGSGEPLNWQNLVKRSEKSTYLHAIFKVCFQARSTSNVQATEMKIRLPSGGIAKGAGWSFLDAHMASSDGFKDGMCKVLVNPQLWCMNGSAGLTLNVVALALRPSTKCLEAKHFCIDEVFPDADM